MKITKEHLEDMTILDRAHYYCQSQISFCRELIKQNDLRLSQSYLNGCINAYKSILVILENKEKLNDQPPLL